MSNFFEFIDHPADVQVHAVGDTLEKAIEQCVLAMVETMTDLKAIVPEVCKEISMEATDKELLLINYLSQYLAIFDIDQLLFSKIEIAKIHFDKKKRVYTIHSKSWGETFNPEKHEMRTEIKAITYSYLKIDEKPQKTEIWIIYDI
jgi:SHS2 domain-containing protein